MTALGMALAGLLGAVFDLSRPGHYISWGFVQISLANLILIGLMIVVFVAALLIPFRRHGRGDR